VTGGIVTKIEQLYVGLIVCETVLEALIHTHPNKAELKRELTQRLAALQVNTEVEGALGEQEQAHMKATVDTFLLQLQDDG
jgi:hypothetical protein